jgi:rhodanese-related sulfurtransferase
MRCLYTLLAFIIVSSAAIARGDVSTTEAAQMMKKSSTIVVDVRTPAEYAEGHLYNSRLIDYYKTDFWSRIALLPKNATIIVYCRVGRRSKDTETKLREMGFLHVYNMLGGFDAWKKEQRKYEK